MTRSPYHTLCLIPALCHKWLEGLHFCGVCVCWQRCGICPPVHGQLPEGAPCWKAPEVEVAAAAAAAAGIAIGAEGELI